MCVIKNIVPLDDCLSLCFIFWLYFLRGIALLDSDLVRLWASSRLLFGLFILLCFLFNFRNFMPSCISKSFVCVLMFLKPKKNQEKGINKQKFTTATEPEFPVVKKGHMIEF